MTGISDIVNTMAKTGCSAEQIAAVVELLESKNEERRAKDRERKRAQRAQVSENKENMSQNVPRTSADIQNEKRKKEPKKEKTTPLTKENPPTGVKRKVSPRGSRLPDGWVCEQKLGEWAMAQGLTRSEVVSAIDSFVDHWRSATGAKAVKTDWDAAFRNWVRNELRWKK